MLNRQDPIFETQSKDGSNDSLDQEYEIKAIEEGAAQEEDRTMAK
jgi:hypothetical protein